MPFGPAIAFFVFALLCANQHVMEQSKKHKAAEKKNKDKARANDQKLKLLAEIINDSAQ